MGSFKRYTNTVNYHTFVSFLTYTYYFDLLARSAKTLRLTRHQRMAHIMFVRKELFTTFHVQSHFEHTEWSNADLVG